MKIGDLVKIKDCASSRHYPKEIGVIMDYRDEGLHEMYNSAYVLWPNTGEQRSVRQMFLELISESR